MRTNRDGVVASRNKIIDTCWANPSSLFAPKVCCVLYIRTATKAMDGMARISSPSRIGRQTALTRSLFA